MILLRISSSDTFRATLTSFGNWWRAVNSSTISATRAISDRLLAMRISQNADIPACGETEDPVLITATGVPSGHIVARTIARCAPRVIAARPAADRASDAGAGGRAGRSDHARVAAVGDLAARSLRRKVGGRLLPGLARPAARRVACRLPIRRRPGGYPALGPIRCG